MPAVVMPPYFEGARVVRELRGGGQQAPEGKHSMFLVVCLSLRDDWRPMLGEAYCLLSSNGVTGVVECFVYFPEAVELGPLLERVRAGGAIMEECAGIDVTETLEEGARALSRVVRASEEQGALYRTFGECPTRLRETALRLMETVDLTGEPPASPSCVQVHPESFVQARDSSAPHAQVLPESFVQDAIRAPAERRLRVAMEVIQQRDEAFIELQDRYNGLLEEIQSLRAKNAEQVAMLAENAAWIGENAAALAQHVAHIQLLTEELEAKPAERAVRRKGRV